MAAQLGLVGPGWPPLHVSDDMALCWDNGDNWATYLSLVCSPRDGHRRLRISKLWFTTTFQVSDSVTFAIVSVADASDMAQLQIKCKRGLLRSMKTGGNYDHFANNPLQNLRKRLQMTEIWLFSLIKGATWLMKLKILSMAGFRSSNFSPRIYLSPSLNFIFISR